MKIWTRIKHLSIGELFKLSLLFLKHPLFIFPTLKATKRTFEICNKLYGNEHHKSNKANAFRHALWNVLICKYTFGSGKNKQKSVFWAQKVTELYEKVTNNNTLDEAMDLHNNTVGRICFLNLLAKNEDEIVSFIQQKASAAKKVASVNEMKNHITTLVYILE